MLNNKSNNDDHIHSNVILCGKTSRDHSYKRHDHEHNLLNTVAWNDCFPDFCRPRPSCTSA